MVKTMDLRSFSRTGARVALAVGLAVTVLGAPATEGRAQSRPALTVSGGASPYDLSGTGSGLLLGAGVDFRPAGPLVVEPGVRFFRYTAQGGADVSFLMPELSLQLQVRLGSVRPYLGAGAGSALVVEGPGDGELTLHGALGARIPLEGRWSLRPEFRVRSVDPFVGSMGDVSLGVRYGL